MTHRDFARPTGVWPPSAVPTAADVGQIDTGAASLLNGDAGGTWSPANPIIIGGVPTGVALTPALVAQESLFNGGVRTKRGGRLYLNRNLWPAWNPLGGGQRTVLVDLMRAAGNFGYNPNGLVASQSPMGIFPSTPGGPGFTFAIPKRYLHQGATLFAMSLNMVVENLGQGTPLSASAKPPSLGLQIVGTNGGVVADSRSALRTWKANTAYDVGTYVIPTQSVADGVAYSCVSAGTSGTVEPTWPGDFGLPPTFDGSTAWEGYGGSGQMPQVPNVNPNIGLDASTAYNTHGSSEASVVMGNNPVGTITFGWANGDSGPLIIDSSQYEYIVTVNQDQMPIPCVTFTSLSLSYTGITTLQTE